MKLLIMLAVSAILAGQPSQQNQNGKTDVPEVVQSTVSAVDTMSAVVLTLEDIIKVALSENISVKVADKEITRSEYAKKGAYAALYPQVDGNLAYQRTIKKQVMYMDGDGGFDIGSMISESLVPLLSPLYGKHPDLPNPFNVKPVDPQPKEDEKSSSDGFAVGRWNTWSGGITASMPLVNVPLWKSLKISGEEVELAVEKARGSRLAMITQVKDAYFAVLLAKEANKVYEQVYANALKNLEITQMRYNAQKASELDLTRAKTTVASAVPDVYNSRNYIGLALWQLKAVMGVDLDYNMDVAGQLSDYANQMFFDLHENDNPDLSRNTSLKQLEIQIEELSNTIKMQKLAYVPSLAMTFNYSYNAMTNDFNFKEYKWTPYSYVGLSLAIPIFSGFKRLNNVRQAKVQYEELKMQQIQAERSLRIAVKSDLSTMETNMNSYYAAQSATETANKGYDIAEKSYQVGRSTLIELNDALLAKAQAELMQWQAVYSFLVAKDDLEQQLGQDYMMSE